MGLPNNAQAIYRRNSIFPDVWSRSCDTNQSKPIQCTGRWIKPRPKRFDDGRAFGSVGGVPKGGNHMINRVSAEPCSALQPRCEDKRVRCWELGATKSYREHARYECRKVGPYLGRALQGYCYHGRKGVLPGVLKRETTSSAMEHLQLKKVLSLIGCTLGCRSSVIL